MTMAVAGAHMEGNDASGPNQPPAGNPDRCLAFVCDVSARWPELILAIPADGLARSPSSGRVG
jgi:hypothetical protein